jgi:hypothetical protein
MSGVVDNDVHKHDRMGRIGQYDESSISALVV